MYQRFIQTFLDKQLDGLPTHKEKYDVLFHTKKVFANMKRIGKGFSGKKTPLFPTIVEANQVQMGEGSAQPTDTQHTPTFDMPPPKPQKTQIARQPKRKITKVPQPSESTDIAADEGVHEKRGRIDEIDTDEDIALVSTHDDVSTPNNIIQDEGIEDVGEEEVVEVVTTAKMLIDTVVDALQVTTAIADILVSDAEIIVTIAPTITVESTKINVEVTQAPKRKRVMIQELEETTTKNQFLHNNLRTELVEESTKKDEAETTQESSSKKEGDELEQERSKK
nr:hypothetical protein [Tanacetum cinerariifolium]